MKPLRSTTRTVDIPVTTVLGRFTWSATCAVRLSPRTGRPKVTDITDLQRFEWGVSYQFDLLDADVKAVCELMSIAKRLYLAATSEPTEAATT